MSGYPCKDCKIKYPACSDKCEKYQLVKAEALKEKKFTREQSIYIGEGGRVQQKRF